MCADPRVADVATGAPEHEIEVTPAMIDAGAVAFDDGSEMANLYLSPSVARYYAEKVLSLALKRASNGPS
jgi:hypothetical protein